MARKKEQEVAASQKSGTKEGFRDAFKKAVTEMLVLRMLDEREMYAYEMIREIGSRTEGALSFNTLYLAIYRLKDLGYIEEAGTKVEGNRARVYFRISQAGRERLAELIEEYRLLTGAVERILQGEEL